MNISEQNLDLFGVDEEAYKIKIEELESQLEEAKAKISKFSKLYNEVNKMIGNLGAEGEIDFQNHLVDSVMCDLHDIDGGVYREMDDNGDFKD